MDDLKNEAMDISKLHIPAGNVKGFFDNVENGLDNGLIYGYEATALIKILEQQIKRIKDKAKDLAISEIGDGSHTVYGVELKKKNGARYYDFSNSPSWVEADKKKKDIEAHLKIGEWIDPETGEVNPPAIENKRADSLTASIKK